MNQRGRTQGESRPQSAFQFGCVAGAEGGHAKAFGQRHEVGVGEVGGDQSIAEPLGLDAADVAEGAVVEHDHHHRQFVMHRGGQLRGLVHEPAVAADRNDSATGKGRLGTQRGPVGPAQIVLMAGGKITARGSDGKRQPADEADLCHILDDHAILRQGGPDGAKKAHLRLLTAQAVGEPRLRGGDILARPASAAPRR